MNEIYCYRAAVVMHTMLRRNFTFTDTRFSRQKSGRCVESDKCIEINPTTATKTSFYCSSVLEKQSVAAFTVTPPKRSLSITLSAGGGRQMSSIGAWSQAKSFNTSSPIIFDSFERRRLLSRNLCSPNWQRWHGQAWEESSEREYEISLPHLKALKDASFQEPSALIKLHCTAAPFIALLCIYNPA